MEECFYSKVGGEKGRTGSTGLLVVVASWMDLKHRVFTQ